MPTITLVSFQFVIHLLSSGLSQTRLPQKHEATSIRIFRFIVESSGACGLGGVGENFQLCTVVVRVACACPQHCIKTSLDDFVPLYKQILVFLASFFTPETNEFPLSKTKTNGQ